MSPYKSSFPFKMRRGRLRRVIHLRLLRETLYTKPSDPLKPSFVCACPQARRERIVPRAAYGNIPFSPAEPPPSDASGPGPGAPDPPLIPLVDLDNPPPPVQSAPSSAEGVATKLPAHVQSFWTSSARRTPRRYDGAVVKPLLSPCLAALPPKNSILSPIVCWRFRRALGGEM